jgi:hypothetical protein
VEVEGVAAIESDFVLGVNLPWVRYGDFGGNAWHPRGGLADGADLGALAGRLQEARAYGATALRWFLFCDGRAGIAFDADGMPAGLGPGTVRDVEMAVRLSGDAGLRLVPVLFDYLWCAPRRTVRGVRTGGRTAILREARGRAALVERVVGPILERFGAEPGILAWDVFNEPEWATFGVGTWRPWRSLARTQMRAWLGTLVQEVHDRTRHLATVGSASARWLDLVRGLKLDVYQPHWYDHLDARAPLASAVSELGLDRPAWLGEFPTRAGRHTAAGVCELARRAGYAGAFAWSLLADDEVSGFAEAAPLIAAWASALDDRNGAVPDAARSRSTSGTVPATRAPGRQERTS